LENLDGAELKIRNWCADYLAKSLQLPLERINPQTKFARLGMDSAMSVFFLVELEDWLGTELASEIVFDHPTIAELARYLAKTLPPAALACAR